MDHKTTIEGYRGTLVDLVRDLGDLRYDALGEFLTLLSGKITSDAMKDQKQGRVKLSGRLFSCADDLQEAAKEIAEAWKISEPHMQKQPDGA